MMKRYFYAIIITFLSSTCFVGCAVYSTVTTNKWLEYELPPSEIIKNGSVFYEGKLSDGSLFSVFYDSDINNDGDYYNAILRQDFGWRRRDSESWIGGDFARNMREGHIYINPYRRVAIYYYPDGKYHDAFKVSIN